MFTPEVIEQLQYYVYRLIDTRTGQTFYVGKGNRVYAHINDALKSFDGQSYESNDEDEISEKIKQIREIKAAACACTGETRTERKIQGRTGLPRRPR